MLQYRGLLSALGGQIDAVVEFNTVGTFSFLPATHSGLSNKHVTSMKELLIFQVEW